jgi:hypothetical protein
MSAGEQLDLLAEVEKVTRDHELEEWASRFERAPWVAPWGSSALGWVCPTCGRLEVNAFVLNLNHGYDPSRPGQQPYPGWGSPCSRMRLLASQERARTARQARA